MKKVVLILMLFAAWQTASAQCDCENFDKNQKFKFGFNLGGNMTNVYTQGLPNQAYTEGGPGFRLGVLAEFKLSPLFALSPRAELSFNSASVTFPDVASSNEPNVYRMMQNSLEFAPLFKVRFKKDKWMPYFIAGPNLKVPIQNGQSTSTSTYLTSPDVAIDAGFGIEKGFGRVFSSLEMKYSLGLVNVNHHPMLQSAKIHNISIVLNFLG